MPIVTTNFVRGRMNKSVDERLLPPGEYINAINVRLGATETTEIGALENSKGNSRLTTLQFNGADLTGAVCIGAYDDGANETMYWFVTSPTVDIVASFNTQTEVITYHVVSTTVLNFNSKHLITGVNKIGNMLFWTDDLNPPRKININKSYSQPVGGVDVITSFDLNVIVQPPLAAPTLNLISQATESNYMETRMISFAYRYKYEDDEYSALSQFTDIAFVPNAFSLDVSTNLNDGMKNIYNAVEVGFNTGGANVVGIDLIFKFSDSNVLNVIEKFIKKDFGWSDNSIQTQIFSNSKIYTILPESELLRLYDNVPRTAKAQTIMGNRLVYGNYVDGYNLIDSNNNTCQMDFETSRVSSIIETTEFISTLAQGVFYTLDGTISYANNKLEIDFSSISGDLKSGARLSFDFTFVHNSFSGNDGTVSTSQAATNISTIFTLSQDFTSVHEMVNSIAFKSRIGTTIDYFQDVADACTLGTTLTDSFNCSITNPTDTNGNITWVKFASGLTTLDEGFLISASPSSNIVGFQIPAMKFNDSVDATVAPLYEYFKFTLGSVSFLGNGNTKSLHSNRNYSVGIVYMDEYLRSTTALVSTVNTIFTPASTSNQKNQIKVTIPTTQKPPSWATKYKFVVKRAEGPYETIYSNFYYEEITTNSIFFRLEGQNQSKVKAGDILRIKSDSFGASTSYLTQEALSVEAQGQNFLTPSASVETGGVAPYIAELAGLYMEIKPTNFNVDTSPDSTSWSSGTQTAIATNSGFIVTSANYPSLYVPCYRDTTGDDENLSIPQGSLVTFDFKFNRNERNSNAGSRIYKYNKTFAASNDYDNLYDFVVGEGVDFQGGIDTSTDDAGANSNTFLNPSTMPAKSFPTPIEGDNQYRFTTTSGGPPSTGAGQTNFLFLGITSGTQAGSANFPSTISARITVQIANSVMVFESIPIDVDNDIYYEDDVSYDITNDFHMSGSATGDQNQTATLPALITLGFFDCFSFGNGVESFKVEDSLIGQSFTLGQRVTSVSEQDFKEADRFAGLTYSGLYNEETNINRLNEFNLGLANFKDCEVSYGPIQILHGRETDIMCLQEDKISYVLAGKDLLSTPIGSGAITSSPLVLGTQIARIEEYGISNNPESFIAHGTSMYFTDAKRSAVLQLKGQGKQQSLNVISNIGMRSYFRNLFTNNFNKQKLGGFDPYMDEYVLASTLISLPAALELLNCNIQISQQSISTASTYTVDFGVSQGLVTFNWEVSGVVKLKVVWDGTNVINDVTLTPGSGTSTFTKSKSSPSTAEVTLTPTGTATYDITPSCPATSEINVVQIAAGGPADENKFIHNQYYWNDTTNTSPISSELIQFGTSTVSSFISTSGQSSVGLFPPTGATVTMQSNKIGFDDFVFDPTVDKFKYLVSNTAYTAADFNTIDAAATAVTPITNPSTGLYESSFTYTNATPVDYLYMIWDYRTPQSISLRYGATDVIACCSGSSATFYMDTSKFPTTTAIYTDATLNVKAANQFYQTGNIVREQVLGVLQPSSTCSPCGVAIPLCYESSSSLPGVFSVCCAGCTYTTFTGSLMKSVRSQACAATNNVTYYHNGSSALPEVNNFVYSNNTGTTLVAAGYYSMSANTKVIYVNSSGMVENLLTC